MDNNDLLRRLRYALRCDDALTAKLINLGGGKVTTKQTAAWRAKESDPEFAPCKTDNVIHFLDGLILDRRGPRETPAASPWPDRSKNKQIDNDESTSGKTEPGADKASAATDSQVDNNIVLKQLRIALSLRSDDVHAILKAGGSALSESEASALFRKPGARNYRKCGDQVLRHFISGLVAQRQNQAEQ